MRAKQLFSKTHDLTNSKRFVAALILLQAKAPAYYAILAGLDIIWTDKVKTAATDGCYIYINPEFFRGLASDSQRAFLLGHEVGHVVLRHPMRGKFYGDRGFFAIKNGKRIRFDYKLYNKAADYVINADLIAHGLEFIPSGLLSEDVSRNDLVDSVYAGLVKENEQEPQEQPQEPQEPQEDGDSETSTPDPDGESEQSGSGSTGSDDIDSEEDGEEEDGAENGSAAASENGEEEEGEAAPAPTDHEGHDEHFEPVYEGDTAEEDAKSDREELERSIDDAIEAADNDREISRIIGSSDSFRSSGYLASIEGASSTDWRAELAEYFTRYGNDGEVSWSRIHKRRFATMGIITPTRKGTLNSVVISIDISSSVDTASRTRFLTEAAALLDLVQPASGCTLIFCNTDVVGTAEVFSGAELLDIEIPYGGGTVMNSAGRYCEENGIEADIHLCFTDGCMYEEDYKRCERYGMVLVFDSQYNFTYADGMISRSGIRAICADDSSMAA